MKKIVILVVVIALLLAAKVFLNDKTETDALRFKNEYEELNGKVNPNNKDNKKYPTVTIDKKNVIKYSDADEILNIIKKGTGVIYFGFPECPWCRNMIPVLLDAAVDTGIDTIYYMNMTEERDTLELDKNGSVIVKKEGTEGYKKLLKALEKHLPDYDLEDKDGNEVKTGEKRIYVPFVVFVYEGEVVGIHDDTVDSQDDPYVLLNKKQKEELMTIYVDYMHKVLNDVCDEKC